MRILTPAYGRDYKTADEARKAYLSGSDWILNDIGSKWDQSYCQMNDFPNEEVKLRFNKMADFILVKI